MLAKILEELVDSEVISGRSCASIFGRRKSVAVRLIYGSGFCYKYPVSFSYYRLEMDEASMLPFRRYFWKNFTCIQ